MLLNQRGVAVGGLKKKVVIENESAHFIVASVTLNVTTFETGQSEKQ